MAPTPDVETWLAGLDADRRAGVQALRALVRDAAPGLGEHIKWNAPSFTAGGDDRITLGLQPKGGFRMVLHRGARPAAADGFVFEDPDGLASWPTPDRGVIQFRDLAEIEARKAALQEIVARWIATTA